MMKKLHITVLVDAAEITTDDPNFEGLSEVQTTEHHVIGALRDLGYEVSVLGAVSDIGTITNTLTEQKPDLVFNLTESFEGNRQMDKNIAALLEMIDAPFTGTGSAGLLLCRDKRLCKELLSLHKIRVPNFYSLPLGHKVPVAKTIQYPLVVKPALEDSSEGISNASLVNNVAELQERTRYMHERWEQPAIAEEFIEGQELYVSLLGNKKLTVLQPRECFFDSDIGAGPQLATYRVKWNEQYREKWNIRFGFAELAPTTMKNISHVCKKVFRALQLRDYGRIDLRLTKDNKVVILEANPNPDLAYGEEVAEAAEHGGMGYEELIDRIIHIALRRYK
jgi:D-alanine-D-alanine ligase